MRDGWAQTLVGPHARGHKVLRRFALDRWRLGPASQLLFASGGTCHLVVVLCQLLLQWIARVGLLPLSISKQFPTYSGIDPWDVGGVCIYHW